MRRRAAQLTDNLEHFWEQKIMKRTAGSVLVVVYVAMLGLIELNRLGLLPRPLATITPTNHFYAVEIAFTVLLFTEVVSLIFGLTRSFSRSIGIQLEILCLILLRDTFKQFTSFSEPLQWEQVINGVAPMVVEGVGALTIFIIIGLYYRAQKRNPITNDEIEKSQFITNKKLIALGLIVVLGLIGIVDIIRILIGETPYPFFETFYTVLIFTDVLMVLLSLRYSNSFAVTFRNFGFSVVTVFIRITLIAPPLPGVLMGIGTALFALSLNHAYNTIGIYIVQETQELEKHPIKADSPG